MSPTVDYLGLAVGFNAVNDRQQSLQGQKVGGVQLARHWESILQAERELSLGASNPLTDM